MAEYQAGLLLYTADAVLVGVNGATKAIRIKPNAPRHANLHVSIEADAAVTSGVVVTVQGRVSPSAAWVTVKRFDDATGSVQTQADGAVVDASTVVQLFPEMRAVISGTFAATAGNDIRVWLQTDMNATRTNS